MELGISRLTAPDWHERLGAHMAFRTRRSSRGRCMGHSAVSAMLWLCLLGCETGVWAWSPGVASSNAIGDSAVPLSVDIGDRNDVVAFYQCIYNASTNGNSKISWTGSVAGCDPGTTSAAFKDDVRRRVNWFRAMGTLPADIEFDTNKNSKAQAAALIMSENDALSHDPATDFGTNGCWTPEGQDAASHGNLALGVFGVNAMDGYVQDPGGGNTAVGHRRWLLFPKQAKMGTGDIPAGGQPAANCLYVIDSSSHRATNAVQGQYYAWPPAGFVPSATVYPRWSLHFSTPVFGSPTFGSATVSMTHVGSGSNIPVTVVHRYTGGALAGDPTIVWEPDWSSFGGSAPGEQEVEVRVTGVTPGASGASTSVTYRVTAINPDVITDPYALVGTTSPPTTGAAYTVTQLTGVGAEKYEVGVGPVVAGTWLEGAEDSPSPKVIAAITGGYSLRTNLTAAYGSPGTAAGTNVFHLTFPSFVNQSFEIDREILPSASSVLSFSNLFRHSATVNRLSAEISTNAGATWAEAWGRNGVGTSSANWDASWQAAGASLSGYSGTPVRVRFMFRHNGSAALSTNNEFGCFLDNIQVTASQELGAPTITDIGSSSNFTLNSTSAGGVLVAGQQYQLRVRPTLGGKVFPFGSPLYVTAVAPSGYASWGYRAIIGGASLDFDRDGVENGIEYAFNMNPTNASDRTLLPGAQMVAGQARLSCMEPAGVSGVSYGAEYSTNLIGWMPVSGTGSGTNHVFTAPGGPRVFMRWVIEVIE